MPSRIRRAYRWTAARYGADPLHLLALLACFALTGYAATRVVAAGIWVGFVVWFVGAAIVHDLLLYPLYAVSDVTAQRRPWRRRRRPSGHPARPSSINYLRVPAALSGLLLLIWFPLILGLAGDTYHRSTGLDTSPYLGRWLLVTGVLFAGSAIAYAIRLRRHRVVARPRLHARAPRSPRSSPSG
ncbi:hypothetical protein HTZ77_00600 [Nonomuraea sp. SMC257]|uniref:Uncharacterized protein n=1 Tax=Nonomuraea montanisoli TaxID=2741721 RepID=A0A7Y6I1E7_9ACTN|nr:hypothetical protein [Nonomuraea montanisoli]NUW29937.1 hypothetical protein [Nonomuraea montanisoli]